MEKISVIIPVYNPGEYLSLCLDSVLSQNYSNIEVLIINDGSTDNSDNVIKEYCKFDNRISYVKTSNYGVSHARNMGIDMATGKYIVFVDSDDYVLADLLSHLTIEAKSFDLVMTGYKTYDGLSQSEINYTCPIFSGSIKAFCDCISLFTSPPFLFSPCFKLFKRELLVEQNIRFPEDINFGEDALFVLNYLKNCNSVKCLPYVDYVYRKSVSGSLTNTFNPNRFYYQVDIFDCLIELMTNVDTFGSIEKEESRLLQDYIEFCWLLFATPLSFNEKQKSFFEVWNKSDMNSRIIDISSFSFLQRIIISCHNHKCFIPAYLLFILRKLVHLLFDWS